MVRPLEADWYTRAVTAQQAHYQAALHFSRLHYWLGIPVIVLTSVVGTSVFTSLSQQPKPTIRALVALGSVLAAVLASLQTFLGLADRAEKHRTAGAKYGAIGRELEQFIARSPLFDADVDVPSAFTGRDTEISDTTQDDFLSGIRQRLDALAVESPNVPLRILRRVAGSRHSDFLLTRSVGWW